MSAPSGTVTFLFTDIEGSTHLAQQFPDEWDTLLTRHHSILRQAMQLHEGYVFEIIGDAFCVAFGRAIDALLAAVEAQRVLQAEPWTPAPVRVRMGILTGTAHSTSDGHYRGYISLARAQRLMSAGHGGQVLVSSPTQQQAREHLPGELSLRDMGAKRLKDLIRPERIYQLCAADLPADFPPLKTLDAFKHNLPAQMTSFIGRENEMAEVAKAIGSHRLVTLTGPGGTGKTRLALQVAADLIDQFSDGVWLVELAALSDPELIPRTILSAFGVSEQTGRPVLETLIDRLREANLLLVVDNCEHLTTACAVLLQRLLAAAPNLKIMATSREALGLGGERIWRVPSLNLPDAKRLLSMEDLSAYEAVQLFVERAALVQPGFALTNAHASSIAQICVRLDGIPLAIELAAARANALNPEQIASRLNDRFRLLTGGSRAALERHQTLRATVDWSYLLLSEPERDMFQRLSVFAGGWTLEAAEAMAARDSSPLVGWLDLLAGLVSKSLVQLNTDTNRYAMLETIRQYGHERLAESGNSHTYREIHMRHFLNMAEELEPRLYNAEGAACLDLLDADLDNFRLALELATESRQGAIAMRFVAALNRLWFSHCYPTEGLEWALKALAIDDGSSRLLQAKVLATAGQFHSDPSERNRCFLQSAEAYRDAGELAESANVQIWLAWWEEDRVKQRAQTEEALAICRQFGYKRGVQNGLSHLGDYAFKEGDYASAMQLFEESLALNREMQRENGIASALHGLGAVHHALGDDVKARACYVESLALFRKLKDRGAAAYVLSFFADFMLAAEHAPAAAALQGFMMAVLTELGYPLDVDDLAQYNATAEALRSTMGEAAYQKAFGEGGTLTLEQAIELALDHA
jgi:predicted ATPase/class 3 adenylate cyclase